MSGHSKWAQIKRQKATADARRGQVFTKLGREITVAARQGGPDPEANFRLRLAIQKAREANMPMENIERAIKRGAGGSDATALEEIVYEGYGPGGAAILVEAMTDNRNRTAAEVRSIFTRAGGNLGETGCVGWLFDARGVVTVDATGQDADEITLQAIDIGAQDVLTVDSTVDIYTDPTEVEAVRRGLERQGIKVTSAEAEMVPKTTIQLTEEDTIKVLKLMDRLEELDDVQKVYTNVEFSDQVLEKYAA